MRVLVCGGRDFSDWPTANRVLDALHAKTPIRCIIEGGASGADEIASDWSDANDIPEHRMVRAKWSKHGRAAGPIRNQEMIDECKPDLVVAFPGGRGTADMVRRAKAAGIRVIEVQHNPPPAPKGF